MKRTNLTSMIRSLALAGALATSLVVQAQPSISSVSPDGSRLFQYSPTLSFLASSPVGVTNVSVSLTVKKLDGATTFQSLTPANGLIITGPSTGETVTANLKSNRLYTANITIRDANGATANQSVSFDTINPSYTFEIEDWNYTAGDSTPGHYFDNPQTNAYAGRATTAGVDASSNNNGNHDYRPGGDDQSGGLATEGTGDNPKRAAYIGTGLTDYNVGWTDNGEYANYTRHFPVGTYNVYLRAANPNNPGTQNARLSGAVAGRFAVPNTGGWQSYQYVPLIDDNGSLVEYVADGTEQTISLQFIDANCNVNFILFVPPDTQIDPVGDIAFGNMYPNGAFQFQATNTFAFEVTSSVDINASGIAVQVNSTNLFGVGTSQTLTSSSGLTVGGEPTARTVSFALASNQVYSVTIQVLDANSNGASSNVVFDTISPLYVIEAEDWNYGGGQFVPEPQVNGYAAPLDGVAEIDYHRAGGGGGNAYGGRIGLSTENANDLPREKYIGGLPDYDIGNAFGGNWCNYTRDLAAGNYNIFVRVSRGDGGSQANAGSISTVTGATTDTQTASVLGTFAAPNTGGWQKYVWQAVRNGIGYPAVLSAPAGGENTMRYTVTGGGHNPGFFLLMPADLTQASPPYVSDFKPDGSAMFQLTNKMTFTVNSTVGITTANIVVSLDGTVLTNLTITGSSTAWQVSAPIVPNAFHTAIITLTDAVGTSVSTNSFGAFSAANYQFEAEDYDFDGGQFIDNPQVQQYFGKGAIANVDYHDVASGGPLNYRTSGTATETINDLPREQFSGLQEYNIAFFENGEWGNYTRNYPVGAYHAYLRVATGNGSTTTATLEKVTSGLGTTTQTTVPVGNFTILNEGWGSFRWSQLRDANNQPAVVIIDSKPATLRLGRPVATPGANANFLMLVPVQTTQLKVTRTGNTTSISLPAQTGYSYQVQYKNKLTDASWTNLGSVIVGNDTIQSVNDTTSESSRFYRAQVSQP